MVNELCELAASGVSTFQFILLSIAILGMSSTLFVLHKKGARARWILPLLLLALTLTTPLPQGVFAQSAENCPPAQTNNQTSAPDEPNAIGGLVDDNPTLDQILGPGNEFEGYEGSFFVLNNDNAPDGDPFDSSTLQLISNYSIVDSYGWEAHLILDPEDQTMPDPNDWWDAPNVWGYWFLDLTCDIGDTDHCGNSPDPGDLTPNCSDPSGGTCWPTGEVFVHINSLATPGEYTIQYTVTTQSGVHLSPATITVTVLPPPEPSPITATGDEFYSGSCSEWPTADFVIDLMDYVSTTGSGTLLPTTIDLNPTTPEIDSSITVYRSGYPTDYITFTVDTNGIVTMTSPMSGQPGNYDNYTFSFTIRDTDDFKSNAASMIISFGCA